MRDNQKVHGLWFLKDVLIVVTHHLFLFLEGDAGGLGLSFRSLGGNFGTYHYVY